MIARFDHRPMLTAVLALSTAVLVVVVITLTALLLTAPPPEATSSSQSGGGNPGAPSSSHSESVAAPEISLEHHAEVVQRLGNGSLR
jgi:hypothetical protein